jgi:hypothetical protein
MTLPARVQRRLARLKQAANPPAELIPAPACSSTEDDASAVAGELEIRFRDVVRLHQRVHKLPLAEAIARALEPLPPHVLKGLASTPPDEITWNDLDALALGGDDEAHRRLWEQVKAAAREEVRTGHAAARAVEGHSSHCWPRATFLAVRSLLIEAWRPRDAAEMMLLDQMAQSQVELWGWQECLAARSYIAARGGPRAVRGEEPYKLQQLTMAQELQQAMAMVERWHKFYLRALEALQKLRRGPASVVVRRAAQVNVARNQVNLARP